MSFRNRELIFDTQLALGPSEATRDATYTSQRKVSRHAKYPLWDNVYFLSVKDLPFFRMPNLPDIPDSLEPPSY